MTKAGLIKEVFKKCYFITTHSKCVVFFNYNAHVSGYDVYYYLNGWSRQSDSIWLDSSSYISYSNLKRTLEELDKLWELIVENNLNN